MRTFEELSMAEREAYIADAQAYLRAEIPELQDPLCYCPMPTRDPEYR